MKVYDGSGTEAETDDVTEARGADPERLKVGIAEYEVTADGAVLTTSGLGSCVAVAVRDPVTGVAGLVHAMLPAAAEASGADAKFADAGTDLLIREMERAGADPARMEAKLAGGSDMLDFDGDGSIGDRNAARARETLADHGVPVVAADVGGDHGRSLRFEAATGDLVVRNASRERHRL